MLYSNETIRDRYMQTIDHMRAREVSFYKYVVYDATHYHGGKYLMNNNK